MHEQLMNRPPILLSALGTTAVILILTGVVINHSGGHDEQ